MRKSLYVSLYLAIAWWLSLLVETKMLLRHHMFGESSHTYRPIYNQQSRKYAEEEPKAKVPAWLLLVVGAILLPIGFINGCLVMSVPMHLYLMWAVLIRVVIFWVVHEWTDKTALLQKMPKINWTKAKATLMVILVIGTLVILLLWPGFIPRTIGYTRAEVMRNSIDEFSQGSIEMFPQIQPEELRLTTTEIAKSIAETKRSSGASWIAGVHLGEFKGVLSWICTVSETPLWGSLLVGDSNRIREVIIIPVTDATGEKAQVVPARMLYGEGLWWEKNIEVHGNDQFPFRTFSRGYVTENDQNELVIVTTSYFEMPFGAFYDPRIHVWDIASGDLLAEYTPGNAPSWVVQRWDETYLSVMGEEFGNFRVSSSNDIDYSVGIWYYSDRMAEPSESQGLRYQMWNNESTAVYIFDNRRNEQIMELLMVATKKGLTAYSMDHLQFIGADDAKETAVTGLPPSPEGRQYVTPIALLYRIGSQVYYHIPIYQLAESHYYPAYFALVRAGDRTLIRFQVGDVGGMIGAVKASYEAVGAPTEKPTQGLIINGTVLEKPGTYDENGNARQWLTIKTDSGETIKVLVKYELLATDNEKGKITYLKVGDWISLVIDASNIVQEVL